MIGRLWVNKCPVCHWRASSLLFIPNGCKVLALASRAFLTESRLLRMSSMGMRWTSLMEWPAWLTCNETGVVMLRAQLYGLGYPRQPFPRATLAEVTFSLFLSKIQPAVYIRIANSSRGARQLGWASCLTSAGRVTLASGTTFLHINALARLIGTSLGVANVT